MWENVFMFILLKKPLDLNLRIVVDHFLPVNVSTTTSGDQEVVSPVDFSTGQFRPTKMYGFSCPYDKITTHLTCRFVAFNPLVYEGDQPTKCELVFITKIFSGSI